MDGRAQLKILGVEWPLRSGWLDRLVGTEVTDEVYAQFMSAQPNPPERESEPVNLAARFRRELGLPPMPGD